LFLFDLWHKLWQRHSLLLYINSIIAIQIIFCILLRLDDLTIILRNISKSRIRQSRFAMDQTNIGLNLILVNMLCVVSHVDLLQGLKLLLLKWLADIALEFPWPRCAINRFQLMMLFWSFYLHSGSWKSGLWQWFTRKKVLIREFLDRK
jgi:hypothetical protein